MIDPYYPHTEEMACWKFLGKLKAEDNTWIKDYLA